MIPVEKIEEHLRSRNMLQKVGSAVYPLLTSDGEFKDVFNKKSFRLFCDMDGVLTDWMGQYLGRGGAPFEDSSDIDWSIPNNYEFWYEMEWMPGGQALWKAISHLSPVILTSAGNSRFAVEGKKAWCRDNLGEVVPVITEINKQTYADSRSILIDDMEKNTVPWESAGGLAVLYKSPSQAIKELYKKVLGT